MNRTVHNKFSRKQQDAAIFAKALSHPARISILLMLAKQKTCICGDMVEQLPMAQSTVSQHLKELKEAGLIMGEIDGPRICYCLNHEIFNQFRGILDELLLEIDLHRGKESNDCCE